MYVMNVTLVINYYISFYRFPNLIVGVMTRDSVRQAFRGGITADQIISYLEQHAHPNVKQIICSLVTKIDN